ncbi:MAG: hypothetical protein ACLRQF_05005 [Thomasclavelia ramosa]
MKMYNQWLPKRSRAATVTSKDGTLLVTLQMGAVTVYGQTAYVDKWKLSKLLELIR